MIQELLTYINFTTCLVFGAILLLMWWLLSEPPNLPPGPRGPPFIGNTKVLMGKPGQNLSRLAKTYGPVFKLYVGGRLMIVLDGYDVIKEALVKHSEIFSGRPGLFVNNTVTGCHGLSQLQARTRGLREQRKFAMACLREIGRVGKIELEEKIEEEFKILSGVLDTFSGKLCEFSPFQPMFYKATSNIIFNICFGFRFEYSDPRFKELLRQLDTKDNPFRKGLIMNFAPWLRYFLPYRSILKDIYKACDEFIGVIKDIIEDHKRNFRPENEASDVIDAFLLEMEKAKRTGDNDSTFTDQQLEWFVADLYLAGAENTSRSLLWCLALLASHPESYDRLRKEIDDVIGQGRTPAMKDKQQMPYTEAVILEVLRYSPIAPIGIPHMNMDEITIGGYTIPQHTFILINYWSISFDPNTWSNPNSFDPRHFLDSEGKVHRPEAFFPFGAGGRVCPGEAFSKMEMFLLLTSLIQRYDFRLPIDEPEIDCGHYPEYSGSPKPFRLCVSNRH